MPRSQLALVGALAILTACGATISEVNQRPSKYYQKQVDVSGRIVRMQTCDHSSLLEVEDARGGRVLARASGEREGATGDWVRVKGIFVPEMRVEDRVLYDVVEAESVTKRREPRFKDLF